MSALSLQVDTGKIRHNAQTIVDMCRDVKVRVAGVTKSCCGMPAVGRAMLAGGCAGLAEARLDNLRRLRSAGLDGEFMLLRSPGPSEVQAVVELADISVHTELDVVRLISKAALSRGQRHRILLMVDVGDVREGIWPDQALRWAEEAAALPGVELAGIGANVACFGGVVPSQENMDTLLHVVAEVQDKLGLQELLVSGGNSSALHLIKEGRWFAGITHLRIGESILLGWDITDRTLLPGTHRDSFRVHAEVIEVQDKPSAPVGTIGPDAFGHVPVFADKGIRRRALLSLGKQDLGAGEVDPEHTGVEVVGATSDHVVLDVTAADPPVRVGDMVSLLPDYGALVGLMTSSFVEKQIK